MTSLVFLLLKMKFRYIITKTELISLHTQPTCTVLANPNNETVNKTNCDRDKRRKKHTITGQSTLIYQLFGFEQNAQNIQQHDKKPEAIPISL